MASGGDLGLSDGPARSGAGQDADRADELFELREQIMALHGVAAHVLRGNSVPGAETDAQDIHDLVEIVESGGLGLTQAGEAIQSCCEPY